MKTSLWCLLAGLLLATTALAVNQVKLNSSPDPYAIRVLESDGQRTILEYTVNGYATEEVEINARIYTSFDKWPQGSFLEEAGYPRLPRLNRSIIIPDDGTMGARVISAKYTEISDIDVVPSKGNPPRTMDLETIPYTFAPVYQQDAYFPAQLVTLREPYILRDYRGVVVEFNALQYNPVRHSLRICTHAVVEINKTAPGGENVLVRSHSPNAIDPQFLKIYQRHFLNNPYEDYIPLLEAGGLLVICHDAFLSDMDSLVQWKNQKGIPTTIVPVSEAGTTSADIKRYIRQFYIDHDLAYVLLVGDAAQVPSFTDGSDPVYSLLRGTDSYPEIFVGRFSAENSAQVQTQVNRTITYEKYPDSALTWYHQGLGTADTDGPCNPEHYDYQHISLLARDLLHWNYSQVDSVYTPWGGTDMITQYLNLGCSILNYAGHGWTYGMGPPYYTVTDVDNLLNDNMLPHIVTIACEPGNFYTVTCFGEAWLRATNEHTGQPTGAIGAYMSKVSQTWFPPYDMQDEGVDLLATDSMVTFGGMCFNGSMLMIDIHGYWGEYEFKNWNIFGDPSVYLRSAAPYPLTVTHLAVIPVGTAAFQVNVAVASGQPIEAMVCGMNEEIYATGYTSAAGQATLVFDPPPTQPGTFTLTVTTGNALPYIAEVDIVASNDSRRGTSGEPLSVASAGAVPAVCTLEQNYPNPFNPETIVRYGLPEANTVKLTVTDLQGRTVAVLGEGTMGAGYHEIIFDGSSLPSGIYLCRLEAGEILLSQKMILLK